MEVMKLRKITVNGEEVEYFQVIEKPDGTTEVTFSKKFDVVTADMREIMRRIHENGYECTVYKDLKHGIIHFALENKDDIHGILFSLNIPLDIYHVLDDDGEYVYVYVHDLPGHTRMDQVVTTTGEVKV